jgi:hypothetical protein
MVRDGLCLLLCAVVACGAAAPLTAGPGDETEARIRNQLAVQTALVQGREHLQRGDHAAAVAVLESQIALIDGNRLYLAALRDAYRGYIADLNKANRVQEARNYITRLEILDPTFRREAPPAAAPSPPPLPAGSTLEGTPTASTTPLAPPQPIGPKPVAALAGQPTERPRPGASGEGGPASRPRVVLGKTEEDDPFSDTNQAPARRAGKWLDDAEREFAARHYEEAGRFYEQAHRAEPDSTQACRERWAYCKLYRVALQLNAPEPASSPDLEREVKAALDMAPRLEGFATDLLRRIQDSSNGGIRIDIRHTPRGSNGWALAETRNFRIFHNQKTELVERVARVAEQTRQTMSAKWFNDANPAAWTPRCDLFLHASGTDYARATGAPGGSPGHSQISLEGGRVILRRINLRCDDPNMVTGVLPHETTHVVLAGRFGTHQVPRWADEGMAVLSEPRNRIEMHLRNLPRHQQDRELFGVGQLMQMEEYPDGRLIGPFYAQSVSLVEFLSQRKGPAVFARFLRDGLDQGYEVALQRHYGIRGYAELQRMWQEHAFRAGVARVVEKR